MDGASSAGQSAAAVLTVTVNPALDVSMAIEHLVPDHKMRAHDCRREAGGGGVNVSRALRRLGVPSTSFVVVGGSIGSELVSRIGAAGLDVVEFDIADTTRESVAITETCTNRQYRVTVEGPTIEDPSVLLRSIVDAATTARMVVLSGGLAPGLPPDFYAQVIAHVGPHTTTIVDSHGPGLAAAAGSATIIKPSQRELAALVGWEPSTADEIERAARQVLAAGSVEAVVASRGPSGALLAAREMAPVWFRPPAVRPVSAVGAGDSMVAGIAASLLAGSDLVEAVRRGVAAGTAAVLTPGSQLCDSADVEWLADQVSVTPAASTPAVRPARSESRHS
jgi:6-phosphofructokinase 2